MSDFDKRWIPKAIGYLKYTITVSIICLVISILVPTQKEAAAIYLIPKIVNNEQIQDISKNSLNLLNNTLAEYLDNITQNKTK